MFADILQINLIFRYDQHMLYVVATPIGNMSDLSSRAIEIISNVDFILSEDTRVASKILAHLGIRKPLISLHEHTSGEKLDQIITRLRDENAALVSDAGTPNISDPGGRFLEKIYAKEIEVSPIPGPSALTTLLSVAPFPADRFLFMGYFPKKKGRQKMIAYIKETETPIIFYESPHRINKTLALFANGLIGKRILIGRELTKKFEQIIDVEISAELPRLIEKGEFVLALYNRK